MLAAALWREFVKAEEAQRLLAKLNAQRERAAYHAAKQKQARLKVWRELGYLPPDDGVKIPPVF